jgi:hypothetical protein
MNQQRLVDTLVDLFGDAEQVTISPQELRDAITVYPSMPADVLVRHFQVLIPALIRHGLLFQAWGSKRLILSATSLWGDCRQRRRLEREVGYAL